MDCQHNGANRTDDEEQDVDDERVARNGPRPAGLEEVFEVFQTDKRAKNTRLVVELLKCNYDVRQCQIRKDESVNDRGQRKQVQKLVCPQLFKRIHSLLADINQS